MDGAAFQIFFNEAEGKKISWDGILRHFHERYASAAKQDYMLDLLRQIHITKFEVGGDETEAKAVRSTIDKID